MVRKTKRQRPALAISVGRKQKNQPQRVLLPKDVEANAQAAAMDPFDMLPDELLANVLTGLSRITRKFWLCTHYRWAAAQVCRRWRATLADCGTRDARHTRCNSGLPNSKMEPFLQGRVLVALAVSDMAAVYDLRAVESMSLGVRGCNRIDLAKAFVVSDTTAGLERALDLVSDDGVAMGDSSRCPCAKGAHRSVRCVMLAVAARRGAHRSFSALLGERGIDTCAESASMAAVRRERVNVVRVLLQRNGAVSPAYAKRLWTKANTRKVGPVVRTLLDAERLFGQSAIGDTSRPVGCLSAPEANPWPAAREQSGWIARATIHGTVAALDLWRERGIAYDPGVLFHVAIMSGQTAFCDALIEGESPAFVDSVRATLYDSIDRRTIGVGSIPWCLGHTWFEPSDVQAIVMARIVCGTALSSRSGARALVDLIERWPSEDLFAMIDRQCVDDLVYKCALDHDVDSARALLETLERCRTAGMLQAATVAPVDLWDHGVRALSKEVLALDLDTLSDAFTRLCVRRRYLLLCWLRLLATQCGLGVHAASSAHRKQHRAWRRICTPRPLPDGIIATIKRDATNAGRRAAAIAADIAVLVPVKMRP